MCKLRPWDWLTPPKRRRYNWRVMKPLEVIPAIDLRGGYAVRLLQGDYAQETRYHDDPVALAQHLSLIHI